MKKNATYIPMPHLNGKLVVSASNEGGKCPGIYVGFLPDDPKRVKIPLIVIESKTNDPDHALTTYIYANHENGEATGRYDVYPLSPQ